MKKGFKLNVARIHQDFLDIGTKFKPLLRTDFSASESDDTLQTRKSKLQTLQTRKSKWTPPEGQFASLDFFVNKCRHDINKLNFNRNTRFSNLSSEERVALKNLSKRKDIIVKAL